MLLRSCSGPTRILVPIDLLADGGEGHVLLKVVELHPEGAIYLADNIQLLPQQGCPFRGVVAPRSLPLEFTPGVSNLKELGCPTTCLNLSGSEDTIGMSAYETSCMITTAIERTDARATASEKLQAPGLHTDTTHEIPSLVCIFDQVPEILPDSGVYVRWRPREISERLKIISIFETLVTAMLNGIGFLQQHHP
jgi:hypothetical protein